MCFCSTDEAKTESNEKFFGGSLSLALGLRTTINPLSGNASAALWNYWYRTLSIKKLLEKITEERIIETIIIGTRNFYSYSFRRGVGFVCFVNETLSVDIDEFGKRTKLKGVAEIKLTPHYRSSLLLHSLGGFEPRPWHFHRFSTWSTKSRSLRQGNTRSISSNLRPWLLGNWMKSTSHRSMTLKLSASTASSSSCDAVPAASFGIVLLNCIYSKKLNWAAFKKNKKRNRNR